MDKLTSYITQQLQAGVRPEEIAQSLISKGWDPVIVQTTLATIQNPAAPVIKANVKKNTIIFAAIGVLLLICIVAQYLFTVRVLRKDEKVQKDGDILAEFEPVAQHVNAFYDLYPISLDASEDVGIFDALDDYTKFDADSVGAFLTKYVSVMDAIEIALKQPRYQNPIYENSYIQPEQISAETSVRLYPLSMSNAAKILSLQSRVLLHQKKDEEALRETLKIVTLGNLIAGNRPILAEYLIGLQLKSNGLRAAQFLLSSTTPSGDFLKNEIDRLDLMKSSDAGLLNAIRMQYAIHKAMIEHAVNNESAGPSSILEIENGDYPIPVLRMQTKKFFLKNATLNSIGKIYRKILTDAQAPCTTLPDPAEQIVLPLKPIWQTWYTKNMDGKVLVQAVENSLDMRMLLEKKCQDELLVRVTQLLFAMKSIKFFPV